MPQSPNSYQSSPSSSAGCCVRPEPLPQPRASVEQYLSQPQLLLYLLVRLEHCLLLLWLRLRRLKYMALLHLLN